MGLDYVVKLVLRQKKHSTEHLHGHSKASSSEVRYFAALCSMSGFMCDAGSLILLEDDRFLRNNGDIRRPTFYTMGINLG